MARLEDCKSNNHLFQPEEHLWMQNPEAGWPQQQKTTRGAVLSAKNRKPRVQFAQAHKNIA